MPVMTFVMTAIMAAALVMLIAMRAASFSRILQFSVQIVSHNEVHIATAAAHHLYVVALQNIQGTFAHAAGQHHFNAKLPRMSHGTGDVYASSFVGALMRGMNIFDSAALAADYTVETIRLTMDDDSHWYGVKFEQAIPMRIGRIDAATGSDD